MFKFGGLGGILCVLAAGPVTVDLVSSREEPNYWLLAGVFMGLHKPGPYAADKSCGFTYFLFLKNKKVSLTPQ